MKIKLFSLIGLLLLLTFSAIAAEDVVVKPVDTTKTVAEDSEKILKPAQFVIYYLHMNRRCMTCKKLEAYSTEAVISGFENQLKDSTIVWKILNFEEEGNEHFAKDYQLYSQSLVISKLQNGKETGWKNLDQIWKLVHTKDEFITYVQSEINSFMKPTEDK